MIKVTKGCVLRWFNIDWTPGKEFIRAIERHDKVFNALWTVQNAKEVNSGHNGFNVCLQNDDRTDKEILKEIRQKVLLATVR